MVNLEVANDLGQGISFLDKAEKFRKWPLFIRRNNDKARGVYADLVNGFLVAVEVNDMVGSGVAAERESF